MVKLGKSILNTFKNNIYLLFLILLGIGVGSFFPSTYWAFVDDGELIEVSQRMSSNLQVLVSGHVFEWLKDPQIGRFRPVYWFYHWLVYILFGINHIGHGLIQVSLILVIVMACYFTAKIITKSKVAGLISGLLFIANTLNQENWYRLGPQEAPLTLFISLSVLAIILYLSLVFEKKATAIYFDRINIGRIIHNFLPKWKYIKNGLVFNSKLEIFLYISSLITISLGYFTKENSIAFLAFPVCLYFFLVMYQNKLVDKIIVNLFGFLLWNILFAFLARFGAIRNYVPGSYASSYIITLANIRSNFLSYISSIWITFEPLIILVVPFLFIKLVGILRKKKIIYADFLNFSFVIVFLSFFAIQIPWQYAIPRYLLPTMYFFALVVGISLSQILDYFRNSKKNLILKDLGLAKSGKFIVNMVWILVGVVVVYNLTMMYGYVARVYSLTRNFNEPLISYLAENTKLNGTIVLDTPPGTALELRQEIGLHLRLFFGRGDVRVKYFDDVNGFASGDILMRAGEFKQVTKTTDFTKGKLEAPKRIDIHLENRLYYPPMQFLKNYLVGWVRHAFVTRDYTFNPVLASSQDNYYWELYKVNISK